MNETVVPATVVEKTKKDGKQDATIYVYNIGVSCAAVRQKVTDYIVKEVKPKAILDLGMGVGVYGLEIKRKDNSIAMYGVDGCLKYLTSMHAVTHYDVLILADIQAVVSGTIKVEADLIILMDVIEHLEKEKAVSTLNSLDGIIMSTPLFWYEQGAVEGNPLEIHKCWFSEKELNDLGYKTLLKEPYDARGEIGAFTKGL